MMFAAFRSWLSWHRARQTAWHQAWSDADVYGDDGLTHFQRFALASLQQALSPLSHWFYRLSILPWDILTATCPQPGSLLGATHVRKYLVKRSARSRNGRGRAIFMTS